MSVDSVKPYPTSIIPDPVKPQTLVITDDAGHTVVLFRAFDRDAPSDLFTCVVRFDALAIKFGYPNNEALPGHALFAHGLGPDGIFEVDGSSWLFDVQSSNRETFQRESYLEYRHIAITSHESTLEVLTRSVDLSRVGASVQEAAGQMFAK